MMQTTLMILPSAIIPPTSSFSFGWALGGRRSLCRPPHFWTSAVAVATSVVSVTTYKTSTLTRGTTSEDEHNAADDQVQPQTLPITKEWDVDRYQDQHSFVWKYGSSLVEQVKELVERDNTRRSSSSHACRTNDSDGTTAADQPGDGTLRILDIGCGSGELTKQLADTIPSAIVEGIDSDPSMIERAQRQFPELRFVQQDVRSLLLPDDDDAHVDAHNNDTTYYDIIFSNAALHWVPPQDIEWVVQSMAQKLKPGGYLVVEMGGRGNVQSILEATIQALQEIAGIDVTRSSSNHLNHNYGPTKYNDPTGHEQQPSNNNKNNHHHHHLFWYFPSIGEFSSLLESYDIEVATASLLDRPTPLTDGKHGISNWLKMFGGPQIFHRWKKELSEEQFDQILDRVNHILLQSQQNRQSSSYWDEEQEQWIADYRRLRVVGRRCTQTK